MFAPFAAFCPCGSTHSLELRFFPELGFHQCNFDGLCDFGGLSACLVTGRATVRLTRTQVRVLSLLACACGSFSTLASDCGWCLRVASLIALFRACCLMAPAKGAGIALRSYLFVQVWMTVTFAAAAALFNFSGQVVVRAAAAFAAAFDFTSLRSLLTGPAAFALAFDAKMVRWHAAAARQQRTVVSSFMICWMNQQLRFATR